MKNKPSSDALDRALTNLYQTDVPAGFHASWRDAVKREESSEMQSTPRFARLKRTALPIAAAAVLIIGTAVTGIIAPQTTEPEPSADDYVQTYSMKTIGTDEDTGYDMAEELSYAAAPTSLASTRSNTASGAASENTMYDSALSEDGQTEERKIVRTVSLTIASTLFDTDYDTILALTESAGGYASAVSVYEQQADQRTASFELKIPAGQLDDFLSDLNQIGRTTNRYETTTDLTTQYTDYELRLQTQQDKMTRLQELLVQAETVEDLLDIENEIADTQYTIDYLQSSLLSIDRQVDYATVSVYLEEQTAVDTASAQELTIGERLQNGWKASLAWLGGFFENMLVFLTAAAPVLVPLIIAYIVYRVVRKRRSAKK